MKCIPLILTIALISLILGACGPASSQPAGPAVAISPAVNVCTVNTFLSRVYFLNSAFSPQPPFNQAPPSSTPIDPNSSNQYIRAIAADLVNAFNSASPLPSFQHQLCNLTGVYINPAGCANPSNPTTCNASAGRIADYSWGFRQNSSPPQRYIGISLALWYGCQPSNNVCAPPLQKYETDLIQAVLARAGETDPHGPTSQPPPDPTPPFVDAVNSSASTSAMSVLATLAHELGHVYWYDVFIVDSNGNPNPGGPPNFSLFCNGGFYLNAGTGGPWHDKPGFPNGNKRWVDFVEVRNGHQPNDVDIKQLQHQLGMGNYRKAGDWLYLLYSGIFGNAVHNPYNGPWASALAAFSPDEDFVETFELNVLRKANPALTQLDIKIFGTRANPYTYDVLAHLSNTPPDPMFKSELVRKLNCF